MPDDIPNTIGADMYRWASDLFPICRSLTGNGVRQTLAYIRQLVPELTIHEVPTGTPAFDWVVPDEWNIVDAYIADEAGNRIVDFRRNNLHVVGYSEPVDQWLTLEDLDSHLHSLPDLPEAIPYVTSYFTRRWGFCLSHQQRRSLKPGRYRAVVSGTLAPGSLTYGELLFAGEEQSEVLLSTYVCHPSMANNELSGPVVTTALARWLSQLRTRRHTYRILFLPETIGAIVYLSRNLEALKRNTVAGFVVTCIGDDRAYSLMPSRLGTTLADKVAHHVLRAHAPGYKEYSFLLRGSDERQYCMPGIDLPVVSIMRSMYGQYAEYHTSLDDLSVISPAGLGGGYAALRRCLELLEANVTYRTTVLGEPQLGKRGLYPSTPTKADLREPIEMLNILAYADGRHDLIDLAARVGLSAEYCATLVERLRFHGLLERVNGNTGA